MKNSDMLSDGDRAVRWVENYCLGADGRRAVLTPQERAVLYQIFDGGSLDDAPGLSVYLVLMFIAGPERLRGRVPNVESVDSFSLWRAASPELQRYLERDGEVVRCPELGTRYPVPEAA